MGCPGEIPITQSTMVDNVMAHPSIANTISTMRNSIPKPSSGSNVDVGVINANIAREALNSLNLLLDKLNRKLQSFMKLINIYNTYKNLYSDCGSMDNRNEQKDHLNKTVQDTIAEITLNKRKTYYEQQETSSQNTILNVITALYWLTFIIFVSVILFITYHPKMRNTFIISIILLILFPILINYLLPFILVHVSNFTSNMPTNVYVDL